MCEKKEMLRFTAGDAITALVKGMLYYLDAGRVDDIVREAVTRGHELHIEEKRRDNDPVLVRGHIHAGGSILKSSAHELDAKTGMTADERGWIG